MVKGEKEQFIYTKIVIRSIIYDIAASDHLSQMQQKVI